MKLNKQHHQETLLHRLYTLFALAKDHKKHILLLPELLIKTIRDSHRFSNEGISYLSSEEIVTLFDLGCTDEEKSTLNKMEQSLRKSKDYQEFCQEYSLDMLISIAKKLQNHLNKKG